MRVFRGRGISGFAAALAALAIGAPEAAARGAQGASGVGDSFFPNAGNGGYQVERYDLRLRYFRRSERIRARARIDAIVGGAPLESFNLDFRGPGIRSLRVNGSPAPFSRSGQELTITPGTELGAGSGFEVVVRYAGVPTQVTDPDGSKEGWTRTSDGAIALGEPQGSPSWFPANDHPTDEASYRIRIKTPRRLVGISNGVLVERRRGRRLTTTRWRQDEPMASYLAMVAIGKFRVERGRLAGRRYLGASDRSLGRRALRILRSRTRRAHRFLPRIAGPYPFAATGGVIDPSGLGYALETQGRPYYPEIPSQDLVVHEIAHQWYGNAVTLNDWSQIWLNEGFATYMEWLYDERHGGPSAAGKFDALYDGNGPGNGGFWNPPPAAVPGPAQMFDGTVYVRGAMALQVLRELIGDEHFFQVLEEWATENTDVAVDTDDFRAKITQVHGGVPPLFDDWLTDPGKPADP